MKKLVLMVVAALVIATPAHAQDTTAEVDKIFSWVKQDTPGCAVAATHNGAPVVNRAYGLADLERPVAITPETVFDVGSVVKQFVAAAVLLLVEDGTLALSDDVRTYIPELPDTGHRITVDHLLTHTSGIRDWPGILGLSATSADALTITLRQRGLDFAPGEEWSYSNSGYVLAKEIVTRVSGISFGEFARQRLFEPLGMTLTHYQYDWREVVKNRALAYEQVAGRWKADMLLDNARGGGGGLLSTASDLLIWNDALTSGRLGEFVTEKIQEPARLNNGRRLGYARGLFLDSNRGGRVVWHSGSANAYNSILVRFPEQGLSVAVLCNAGDIAETAAFSRRIFDVFVPAPGSAVPPSTAGPAAGGSAEATLPGQELTGKAGLFFSERSGMPLRLAVDRTTLRIVGGPPLIPTGTDTFRPANASLSFMSQDQFELRFVSQDRIELTSMEGVTTTYRRAEAYAPTAADLAALAGRYESDEIASVFQVVSGERSLTVRLAHAPNFNLEFVPVAPDTFLAGNHFVRFVRDSAGNATGFAYSNPVLRNVIFTRPRS